MKLQYSKVKNSMSYHKTGFKLLKYLHYIDSSAIPLSIINAVFKAAFPFIGILLSSEIIDKLLEKEYKTALVLVAVLIGADFITGMIIALLNEVLEYKKSMIRNKFTILLRKKGLELDYQTMSRTDIMEKISYTERMSQLYGGLESVLGEYVTYLSSAISIITASVLTVQLCFAKPHSIYKVLNFVSNVPTTIIVIIMLLFSTLKLTLYISRYFDNEQKKLMKDHTSIELKLSYMIDKVLFRYETGKVSRIFSMNDMLMENYHRFNKSATAMYKEISTSGQKENRLISAVNMIFSFVSYIVVIAKILAEAISVGSFTKYTGALIQLNNNVTSLIESGSKIKRICNYMNVFISFMDEKSSMETGSIPIEKRIDNVYEIEFHDVSFHYPDDDNLILDHVSCKLTLKNKMAVVGRNGAGKSTFIKLLCRLYDPTDGYITLNGIDIRKYDYKQYQSIFSVVFQDFKLFSFPIGENVAASKEVDEEKAWNCLEKAGISERIKEMSEKLKTPLYKYEDDGVEISGGEAQKIAIARALYKDSPFVILDEPTAALDPLSEAEIYSKFGEMTNDKTSIFISHRMSSCRFCDDIIVFDKGKIVERGSHDELLKEDKYYASMWKAQSRYYA